MVCGGGFTQGGWFLNIADGVEEKETERKSFEVAVKGKLTD